MRLLAHEADLYRLNDDDFYINKSVALLYIGNCNLIKNVILKNVARSLRMRCSSTL